MIIEEGQLIQLLLVIAAGLCGFSLGGLSNCNNKALRTAAWFIPGVIVGVVIAVITTAFITIN